MPLMDEKREMLRRELPGLEEAVPLAPLCAYRVGGPAEFLFTARETNALSYAVLVARELELPVTVLGRATNVLVADAGLHGLVVLARNERHALDGDVLKVEAGAELPTLVAEMAGQGLAGLEYAGNIPGSVGGAVVGNAGAYGRSVSEALVDVQVLEGRKERRGGSGRAGVRLPHQHAQAAPRHHRAVGDLRAAGRRVRPIARRDRPRRGPAAQQAPPRVRLLRQLLQESLAGGPGRAPHRRDRAQGPRPSARRASASATPTSWWRSTALPPPTSWRSPPR